MSDLAIQQAMNEALEHQRLSRFDEAADVYRRIISADARQAGAMGNLADVLMYCGHAEDAVEMCRRAMAVEPENAAIHSSLSYKLRFHPEYNLAKCFAEDRRWNERHGGKPAGNAAVSRSGKVRIGYVSPDFYGHAECFFVIPLLRHHDRKEFEIHCYSSVRQPDKATDLIRGAADVWHDVRELSDEQLVDTIRHDKIDILVDLTMHMAGNRLGAFARKPAPVQVTWLAYPGGTGLTAMDFRLTDPWIDPAGACDAFYAERSVRLTETWCCYHPLGDVPPAAAEAGRPITFGCLNNPCKLNRPTLKLWAKTLGAIADSRMVMLCVSQRQRCEIAAIFSEAGVAAERLQFVTPVRRGEYLRLYDRIDICLDPLIYNGITTSCDALWMGVPVITRVGDTAPGRAGLSILSNLDLPELIAQTDDQFIEITARLATDSVERSHLRAALRDRMVESPLMDGPRFAQRVEAAYLEMRR